jgi:hypothetical protein
LTLLPDYEIVLGNWARKFHVSPRNAFSLIACVGEDCAGAVQFVQPERLGAILGAAAPPIGINRVSDFAARLADEVSGIKRQMTREGLKHPIIARLADAVTKRGAESLKMMKAD